MLKQLLACTFEIFEKGIDFRRGDDHDLIFNARNTHNV